MIKIQLAGSYQQKYRKLVEKEPKYKKLVLNKVRLFQRNPGDTRLKNHSLRKRMQGKWSFSINNDVRIVYEWMAHNTARFLVIGKHSSVYLK